MLQRPNLLQPQASLPHPGFGKVFGYPSFGELLRKTKPPMLMIHSQWWRLASNTFIFQSSCSASGFLCDPTPHFFLALKCRPIHIVHVDTQLSQLTWILKHNSPPLLCYRAGKISGTQNTESKWPKGTQMAHGRVESST